MRQKKNKVEYGTGVSQTSISSLWYLYIKKWVDPLVILDSRQYREYSENDQTVRSEWPVSRMLTIQKLAAAGGATATAAAAVLKLTTVLCIVSSEAKKKKKKKKKKRGKPLGGW